MQGKELGLKIKIRSELAFNFLMSDN
jgi:hypothetical protein